MRQWYVTVQIDGDPRRTRDDIIKSDSEYAAGWLYRYLNPETKVVTIRPMPEDRQ